MKRDATKFHYNLGFYYTLCDSVDFLPSSLSLALSLSIFHFLAQKVWLFSLLLHIYERFRPFFIWC